MGCIARVVPITNVLIAFATIALQIATFIIWVDLTGYMRIFFSWDLVSSGLWGGVFISVTSILILREKLTNKTAFQTLVAMCALCGAVMIGMYSWAIHSYLTTGFGRFSQSCMEVGNFYRIQACDSVVISSIFIVLGAFLLVSNTALVIDASSTIDDEDGDEDVDEVVVESRDTKVVKPQREQQQQRQPREHAV